MSNYQNQLKKHMHFQFNMVGLAFLCLSLIGAAGYFFKDALWSHYESFITIFAYGFVDNIYDILIKLTQSIVPFFLLSFVVNVKNHQIWSKPKIRALNQIALIFLGLAVYLILSAATSGLITAVTSKNVGVASIPSSLVSNFLEVQWTYLFYLIVLCPIVEEYIYRGVVLQCFARYGNRFAIVASSFLFALSFGRLQTALPGFFLGVFLAVIALYYQSILPVIWIRIGVSILSVAEMLIPLSQVWIFGVICLVSYGISLIFLFVNRYNRLVFRSEADEGFSAKVFATSWLLVLACGVMIALTYSLPLRQMIEQWVSRIVF